MSDLQPYSHEEYLPDVEVIDASPAPPAENPFGSFLATLRRFWYLPLLSLILVGGGGVVAVWRFVGPEYTTVGAIHVKPILVNVYGEKDTGDISNYGLFLNTQADLMQQDEMLRAVADKLVEWRLNALPSGENPLPVLQTALVDKKLLIYPDSDTEFIKVSMTGFDPQDIRKIVNAIIETYTGDFIVEQNRKEQQKYNELLKRREKLNADAERERLLIRQKSMLYGSKDLASRKEMFEKRLSYIREEYTKYQLRKINLEIQIKQLSESKGEAIAPSERLRLKNDFVNNDLELGNLIETLTEREGVLIEKEQLLKPDHPSLIQHRQQIQALKDRIANRRAYLEKEFDEKIRLEQDTSKQFKLDEAKTELSQIEAYLKTFEEMISDEEKQTQGVGSTQIEIDDHEKNLELIEEELDTIRVHIRDVELENKSPARVSLAYEASDPILTDKRPKMMLAVLVAGLGLGLGLVFLLDKCDSSLRTPEDVIRCIDVPVIGTTTAVNKLDRKALPQQLKDDYQSIRTNLGLVAGEGIPPVLAVTSPGPREGKTTFAINLAASLAGSGYRVLLLDGDFRKPDVGPALSLNGKTGGLQKLLFGTATIEEAVAIMPETNLHILTSDPFNVSATFELLHRPQTRDAVRCLTNHYDHIVIDCPPILAAPDALLWSKIADAVVLIGFSGQTNRKDIKDAVSRLAKTHARILGAVLTSVSTDKAYYRYGYGYYHKGDAGSERRRSRHRRPLLLDDSSNRRVDPQAGKGRQDSDTPETES